METQLNVGSSEKSINFAAVVKLANSSPSAGKVFHDLADRKKHLHRSINLESYAQRLELTQDEALTVFRELETQGLGSVVIGREGVAPTQFIPYYNLKAIGSAGIEGQVGFNKPVVSSEESVVRRSEPKKFNRSAYMKRRWAGGGMSSKGKPKTTNMKQAAALLKQAIKLLKKV